MKIKFSKMHGLGNDFIVINNVELAHRFTPQQIYNLAHRKLGIGCDQLLLIEAANDGSSDFYYRIFNSDGSEALQCGNGARCCMRYIVDYGLARQAKVTLQTAKRQISGEVLANGEVVVAMGNPQFAPAAIPLTLAASDEYQWDFHGQLIKFRALSMGNPHAVILVADEQALQATETLARIGQELQASGLFPEGVNVNFVFMRSEHEIELRTYERGCGFTLACGSGACASAAALIQAGLVANKVRVVMSGGSLHIKWDGCELWMQGPATAVFDGEIELCAN